MTAAPRTTAPLLLDQGVRLTSFFERSGLTRTEFAAALGCAERTLRYYFRGDRPLDALQVAGLMRLGCDPAWYLTGSGGTIGPTPPAPPQAADMPPGPAYTFVPRYDIAVSAGPGTFADTEQVIDHVPFRTSWIEHTLAVTPSSLVLVTAVGDSMMPTISAGDLLLVDTTVRRHADDAIYVIGLGDTLHCKRVQRIAGGVRILSDNPRYEPVELIGEDASSLRVAGRVRWSGHTHR